VERFLFDDPEKKKKENRRKKYYNDLMRILFDNLLSTYN